ncbi:MAG: hypothetical protein PHY16_13510 [Methylobacter sp.]|nr:hypothetical protein [Methylobacter sp.]
MDELKFAGLDFKVWGLPKNILEKTQSLKRDNQPLTLSICALKAKQHDLS